jgi:hypothetical protein
MKTKEILIRLRVPGWFPGPATKYRLSVAWKTLKYRLNPCKCMDCGGKLDYRFPEYSYHALGKQRVILSSHMYNLAGDNKGLCGFCLAARIHALFARIKPNRGNQRNGMDHTGTIKHVCDGCGEKKATLDISWDPECDIRFGSSWWNGHHICEDCLCTTAEIGKATGGQSYYVGGKCYQLNHAGAVVDAPHWYSVLFNKKGK